MESVDYKKVSIQCYERIEQVKMGPILTSGLIHLQPTNSSEPDCFSNSYRYCYEGGFNADY